MMFTLETDRVMCDGYLGDGLRDVYLGEETAYVMFTLETACVML